MRVDIYFDGACDNNSKLKVMGTGVVAYINEERISKYDKSEMVGTNGTNNIAEYMAMIKAIEVANEVDDLYVNDLDITIHGDSKLVIEQMNGNWKVKSAHLKSYYNQAKELVLYNRNPIKFRWIPRERNTQADILSKECLKEWR